MARIEFLEWRSMRFNILITEVSHLSDWFNDVMCYWLCEDINSLMPCTTRTSLYGGAV